MSDVRCQDFEEQTDWQILISYITKGDLLRKKSDVTDLLRF